jgi:4-amino-4-deoxy-L-arabinose transferase-like glycosyltransferase
LLVIGRRLVAGCWFLAKRSAPATAKLQLVGQCTSARPSGTFSAVAIFPDELRLAITLGLNVFLAVAAYRFARRWVDDRLQAALDALLFWYLAQYLAVTGTGLLGCLSGGSIVIVGLLTAVLLLLVGAGKEAPHGRTPLHGKSVLIGASLVLLSYLFSIIWGARYAPTIANDSLAYQLPTAVQWLKTGRLALLPVWFFNPANSYSPLAGSTFVAWLMGPMGNDVLARFVEAPALVFLFLAVIQLCRTLGASMTVAALLGLAVACARPFISQTILAKDDLPLAAFLTVAMLSLSTDRLRDLLGPWRLGVAIGLLLATKFTATFCLPPILLAIDAPWRAGWRWRKHALAAAVAVVLFGPWYARNWICFGSPAFPFNISVLGIHLFNGPLTTIRTDRMNSVGGIVQTLTGTYYSMPTALALLLLLTWGACIAVALQRGDFRRPLTRACLLGPMLAIVLFVIKSPAAEIRFVAPNLALLLASTAALYRRWNGLALLLAAALATTSIATGFTPSGLISLLPAMWKALAILIAGFFLFLPLHRRGRLTTALLGMATLASWAYVAWPSYLNTCRAEAAIAWSVPYGPIAQGWEVIRAQTPPGCTVAYANTFLIYPLYGFDLSRRLIYAPTVRGIDQLSDLPKMRPVIGEDVPGEVSRATTAGSDRQTWMDHLHRGGADYLFVAKLDLANPNRIAHPPELGYVSKSNFELMFENDAVNVYRVIRNQPTPPKDQSRSR